MQIETESRKSVTAFDIRAETRRRGVAGRGPILLIGVGVLIAMVLIAVTAGGLLWGIAGALLFVPLTAAGSAAAHELWERRGSPPVVGA